MFRMDRVEELTVLDVDGTPPPGRRRATCRGHLPARPRRPLVTLRLLPGAIWIADYYPWSPRRTSGRRGRRAARALRTADTAWLRRLLWRTGGGGRGHGPSRGRRRGGAGSGCRAHGIPGGAPGHDGG